MSDEFKPLADAIYRERVLRARRTPPEERILDGPRLFDYACSITLAGLKSELPSATDRKSTRLNSSHIPLSRMPSSA